MKMVTGVQQLIKRPSGPRPPKDHAQDAEEELENSTGHAMYGIENKAMDDKDFTRAVAAIKGDRTSGAGDLARQCLALLAQSGASAPSNLVPELWRILDIRAGELAAIRPSMAPVGNLVARWRDTVGGSDARGGSDLDRLRNVATEAAKRISAESEAATARVAARVCDYMREFLGADRRDRPSNQKSAVLTLSWSGVVAEALTSLHDLEVEVVVAESRPLNEGANLARYLAGHGLTVTLITDAQLSLFAEQVDMALCGADTLFSDGAILNKAGTRLMALAMADANRPLVAACESFKAISTRGQGTEDGAPPLEEMPETELGYGKSTPFDIRNIYFEVTPARLIATWCTEIGIAHAPADLNRLLAKTDF